MSGEDHSKISRRWRQLVQARMVEVERAMEVYDREKFYPVIKALREECAAIGHDAGSAGNNGFGTSWLDCRHCGARFKIKTEGVKN